MPAVVKSLYLLLMTWLDIKPKKETSFAKSNCSLQGVIVAENISECNRKALFVVRNPEYLNQRKKNRRRWFTSSL